MIAIVQRFRHWLADDQAVYECRHCGTTLDEQQDGCPTCGAEDVVCYTIS